MPIDWNNLDVQGAIDGAARATDQKLASRITALTNMSVGEVQELFPDTMDQYLFTELMDIVRSSDQRRIKMKRIAAGYEDFGNILLTVLDKVI